MKKMRSRKSMLMAALVTAGFAAAAFMPALHAQTASSQEKIQLMRSALQARTDGNYEQAKQQLEQLLKLAPEDKDVQNFLIDVNKKLEAQKAPSAQAAIAEASQPQVGVSPKGDKTSPVPVRPYVEPEAQGAASAKDQAVDPDARNVAKMYNDEVVAAQKAAEKQAADELRAQKAAARQSEKDARGALRESRATGGNYAQTREQIATALEQLPEGEQFDGTRESLKRLMADTIYNQAYAAYDEMLYTPATNYLNEYVDYVGGKEDGRAAKLRALIDAYSQNHLTQNIDVISPGYANRQKVVNDLLLKARAQYMQGDLQGAIATFRDVELRDPDNVTAKGYQAIILRELENSAKLDHAKTRAEMLDAVNRAWQRPQLYQQDVVVTEVSDGVGALLKKRMAEIKFPRVSFTDMPLNKVIDTLVELVPDYAAGETINMITSGRSGQALPNISITLRDMTLAQILKYIVDQVGWQYEVTNEAVIVKPADVGGDLETRFFPITRAVVIRLTGFTGGDSGGSSSSNPWASSGSSRSASAGPSPAEEEAKLKEFFQRAGVPFEGVTGANMAFDGTRIIATNTPKNLERLDNILKRYTDLKQVEIEAKFLDVQEGSLKELGFNWAVHKGDNYFRTFTDDGSNMNLRPMSKSVVGTNAGAQSTVISRVGGPSPDPIPQTIPSIPGALNLGEHSTPVFDATVGVINGYQVQLMIQALDQTSGYDMMAAPKVTVLSGRKAEIVVAQQLRYPTSFGDVQSEVGQGGSTLGSGGSAGVTITAGTPQDFEVEQVGVTMEVTPTVEEDDSISLALEPKVTEFEGFIEYGGTSVAIQGDTTVTVPTGFIQPVFSTRMIRTEVTIFDGATVVMGGLTREDMRTVKDKIPILGDIPLVGRLFQSKGESSTKRNLLIFVTANLISPGGAPARQNFTNTPAGSLFQNPTLVTPAASARRTLDDTTTRPRQ